jgi:hypothetical protein
MEHAKPSSVRRCAIYTRKSSEEGLEQDFNSLHAQREACEAFIKSQAGEGWRLIKSAYDDGGLSGGTMERPALKRLLPDIGSGLVDVIVVYKVDRLTRSLADFAKMVEVFENFSTGSFSAPHDAHRALRDAPHSAQNFRPSRFSAAHFEQRILRTQLVEQRLCIFQIGGVEAFGEPAVDFGEHRARLITPVLFREQASESRCRAQLPQFSALALRNPDDLAETVFGFRCTGCALQQQQLSLDAIQSRLEKSRSALPRSRQIPSCRSSSPSVSAPCLSRAIADHLFSPVAFGTSHSDGVDSAKPEEFLE